MNQNRIDDIWFNPQLNFYPPQLGLAGGIFEIFSAPQLGKFQKKPTPQPGKVGGT